MKRDLRHTVGTLSAIAFLYFGFCHGIVCAGQGRAKTHGLTGARVHFPLGKEVNDVVGLRYKFLVTSNESPRIKIVFCFNRLRGTGKDTYLIESNLYADGLRYGNSIKTTWPMKGKWLPRQASLRIAAPDWNNRGQVGAKTFAPQMFPRQTYFIDGFKNASKTDMISQTDLDGQVVFVEILRGKAVADKNGWKHGDVSLDGIKYRQWDVKTTFGGRSYAMAFALPDDGASYFLPAELLNFGSEFLHTRGVFTARFWDMQLYREKTGKWQPLEQMLVTKNDGSLENFGIRLVRQEGQPALEFSNDAKGGFLGPDTIIDLSKGIHIAGDSELRRRMNMDTLLKALERLRSEWHQPSVDAANGILTKPMYDEKHWRDFFNEYFMSHKATGPLWAYLFYPTFGWFDDATHHKLQFALNSVCKWKIESLLSGHLAHIETYFKVRPDEREEAGVWVDFLRKYQQGRVKTLQDQGNGPWLAVLTRKHPGVFAEDKPDVDKLTPQARWLREQIHAAIADEEQRKDKPVE